MPVIQTAAFAVHCDLCNRHLTAPPSLKEHHRFEIHLFLSDAAAQAAARSSGWTLGHHLIACPTCSLLFADTLLPPLSAPPTS